MSTPSRVTDLLLALRGGDRDAFNELFPLVYDELHAIAQHRLRSERADHTLSPTALVHEAYLKLARLDRLNWTSRAQFLAIAAQAMRQVLVSHARRRKRLKRGGGARHTPIDAAANLPAPEAERILALDAALDRLSELNDRHARIVECRFFGGMTVKETASALEISPATVKRDWLLLRAWLSRELEGTA